MQQYIANTTNQYTVVSRQGVGQCALAKNVEAGVQERVWRKTRWWDLAQNCYGRPEDMQEATVGNTLYKCWTLWNYTSLETKQNPELSQNYPELARVLALTNYYRTSASSYLAFHSSTLFSGTRKDRRVTIKPQTDIICMKHCHISMVESCCLHSS